jgi:hypothetical protein
LKIDFSRRDRYSAAVRLTLAAIALLLPLGAHAGSLSLEAHEIGTRDGFQSACETDWGSYDRDYARGKVLLVTVRDLSRKVPECDVTVYFIARPVGSPNGRFIYHRAEFPVHFRGRIELSGPVNAPELHARIVNLAAVGRRYGNGADMDGWIVVGRLNEKVFDVRASSQTLLDIARAEPRDPASLVRMDREYTEFLENGRH